MSSFSDDVRRHVFDLAWSLWAEVGVSGWTRTLRSTAIDIEALIVFTASIGDGDARLRDEATDWCIRYGELVSKVRLKNVLKLGTAASRTFDEFAATVNAHSALSWPTRARPRRFSPSMKSELDLSRPGLLQLRARAVFGVTARAEILATYAIEPSAAFTLSSLAQRIHFGRRITVEAVGMLRRAAVLRERDITPAHSYVLDRTNEVRALLAPIPDRTLRWMDVFAVVAALWDIAVSVDDRSQLVRAVEAQKRLDRVRGHVASAGLPHVPSLDPSAAGWTRLTEWARAVMEQISAGG